MEKEAEAAENLATRELHGPPHPRRARPSAQPPRSSTAAARSRTRNTSGTHITGQSRPEEVNPALSLPLTVSDAPPKSLLAGVQTRAKGNERRSRRRAQTGPLQALRRDIHRDSAFTLRTSGGPEPGQELPPRFPRLRGTAGVGHVTGHTAQTHREIHSNRGSRALPRRRLPRGPAGLHTASVRGRLGRQHRLGRSRLNLMSSVLHGASLPPSTALPFTARLIRTGPSPELLQHPAGPPAAPPRR